MWIKEGEKIPFDHLPSTAKLGLLQKHIKDILELEVGRYDIKYFDGEHDLSIRSTSNLEYYLRHAIPSPIVLKVVKSILYISIELLIFNFQLCTIAQLSFKISRQENLVCFLLVLVLQIKS